MWLRCAINKFTLEEEEEAIKLFLPPPPLPNVPLMFEMKLHVILFVAVSCTLK